MKTHELKILQRWFDRIESETKLCEVRKNDRDYQTGDRIVFSIDHIQTTPYEITHVLHSVEGLQDGYVVLSIKKI